MVKMDPKKARVTLPDAYLLAIGKVCVQWTVLESIVEMVIIKLSGLNENDARGKIMVNHVSWPQRLDIMGALVDQLVADYPKLQPYQTDVEPLLKKAQVGRNRVVHGFWGADDGKIKVLRATARGKLKLHMEEITVAQIDEILGDINAAIAGLWNTVIGT